MEQTVVRIRTLEIGSGMPKICVPVVGKTEKEILEGAERAKAAKPDLVEFRVDWFEEAADSKKVVALLEKLRKCLGELPVLFTFRSSREGGEAALSDGAYQSLNEAAIASGFVDCVDVELFSGDAVVKAVVAAAHSNHVKVIASNHDFEKTPAAEELLARLQKMEALGADIPKIAVMPQSSKDVLTLLTVTESWRETGKTPVITMSMAGEGLISRLCGEIFGSAVTFGAAGKSSAPGQIDAEELRRILEIIHQNSNRQ